MALDTSSLSNYLKGITNAIRKKKGTSGAIQHNLIDEEIASIPTGFTDYIETSAFGWGLFNNRTDLPTYAINQTDFNNYNFRSARWMFCNCVKITTIPNFNTTAVKDFDSFLRGCYLLNAIPNLDFSNGVDFDRAFQALTNLKEFPNINTSKGVTFSYFLANCFNLKTIPNLDFSNGVNFYYAFGGMNSLEAIPESFKNGFNHSVNFASSFINCYNLNKVNNFNLANAFSARAMFYDCYNLNSVDNFNCCNIPDISGMFYNCSNLHSISNFYTNSCEKFNCLFQWCFNLIDYPNSISIESGTHFNSMFYQCSNLTNIPNTLYYNNGQNFRLAFCSCNSLRNNLNIIFGLDNNNIDTSYMFSDCQNIPVVNFIFSNNNNIYWNGDGCFQNCYSLTEVSLGGGNCSSLYCAFKNCYNLQQIYNLLILNNAYMCNAFYNCQSLHTIDTPLNYCSTGWTMEIFYNCKNLTNIRFVENQITANFNLKWSPLLSSDSINSIANGLNANVTNQKTLTLNSNLKNNLTEEQIATITTTKGWSLAYA